MIYNQKIGKLGENIAVRYLRKHGYRILDRNKHFRCGEIDIIALKNKTFYFVEVKTRTSSKFGDLENSISDNKLQRLENSVENYLLENNINNKYELLFIFVFIDKKNKKATVFSVA